MNCIIRGNGVAGIHAAETIRQLDPNGKPLSEVISLIQLCKGF